MNIVKRELKIDFASLCIWLGFIIALFLVVFLVYPSISASGKQLEQMLDSFPKEILASFNMDLSDISTAYGWFKGEGLVLIMLLSSCYAASLGSTIIAKEDNDKTSSFLVTRPVTRGYIVRMKLLSGVLLLVLFDLILYWFLYAGFKLIGDPFDVKIYTLLMLGTSLIQFLFFLTTFAISTLLSKTKKSMGLGIGLVLVAYFMQIVGNLSDKISIIKKISFFEFASTRRLIQGEGFDLTYLVVAASIIIISICFSFYHYHKREFV